MTTARKLKLAVRDFTCTDNTPVVARRRQLPCKGLNEAIAATDIVMIAWQCFAKILEAAMLNSKKEKESATIQKQ